MLSKEQYREKCLKVSKCVELFINILEITEEEISKKTGIPQTSVDRYLKDEKTIKFIYPEDSEQKINLIKAKLKNNKFVGTVKGGIKSQAISPYQKDENGKFIGSKRI